MKGRLAMWLGLLRTRRVQVAGHGIAVPPGVLDPVLFRSGAWLAEQVAARAEGRRVLDLGCGSGVVGVLAQAAGASVIAVDLDPRAVAAARANGLPDVRQGDLFAPVAGERFDLVAFNPPYYPGRPGRRPLGRALYGGERLEVVSRFAAALPAHLAPGGEGLVVLSEQAPEARAALGPGWEPVAEGRVEGERLVLLRYPGSPTRPST